MTALLCSRCIEEAFGPVGSNPTVPNLTHQGLWIVNEGNFTLGQGSLSFYDFLEDSLYNDVFRAVNGRPLGDVFHSLSFYEGRAFLVINNSRKIEVVDSMSFEHIHTISDLSSPRKVLGYAGKLFVTDLYSGEILVLNAETYEEVDRIESGGWTESMLIVRDKLYVTVQQTFENNLPGTRKGVLCIDPATHELIEYIPLVQGANSLVRDKVGKVHVLCDGGLEEEVGGLFRINPASNDVEVSLYFPSVSYTASALQTSEERDALYFILSDPDEGTVGYDIMKTSITTGQLPDEPLIDGGNLYIYGLYVDEARNMLFFNDAVGLVQEGYFYRYSLDSLQMIDRYRTGIFPSQISASR